MHAHEKPEPEKSSRRQQSQQPSSQNSLLALQRTAGNTAVAGMVQRATAHDVLRSSGSPLDEPVRAEMEARLGADFSSVRVHTDAAAGRSAAELGARAYTSGEHVVIGEGGGDRHTLAHELTHVIQQRNGPVAGTVQKDGLAVSDPGDAFERAAEANARRVMTGAAPEVQPAVHDHSGTSAVQRMPLAAFNQHLATTAVAQDPDFVTFFEFKRGQEDPDAVLDNAQPANRLQQLVQANEVDAALVDSYIQEYQALGPGAQRQQPGALNNPNVTGLEIELGDVILDITSDVVVQDYDTIAASPIMTPAGLPVIKLEVEGLNRMSLPNAVRRASNVEIIYGPLQTTEYARRAMLDARKILRETLRGRGNLNTLITAYNNKLTGHQIRYRMTPVLPLATSLKKGLARSANTPANTSGSGHIDTQTNVSTPYTKLGTPAANPNEDFAEFFEDDDRSLYLTARGHAGVLVGMIDAHWATRPNAPALNASANMNSLLTQIVFHEAKYLKHQLNRNIENTPDKYNFHVMLKLSPQDVVMSVLSDDDAKLLLAWLTGGHGDVELANRSRDTFRASGTSNLTATVDAAEVRSYLVKVLVARLLAGRQLLQGPGREASVLSNNNRPVGQVTHFHPRASNRIPIRVNNNQYYMVVEQRVRDHPLNNAGLNPQQKVDMITGLQHP